MAAVSDIIMVIYCTNEYQAFKATNEGQVKPLFIVRHKKVVYGTFCGSAAGVFATGYLSYLYSSGSSTLRFSVYVAILALLFVLGTLPVVRECDNAEAGNLVVVVVVVAQTRSADRFKGN